MKICLITPKLSGIGGIATITKQLKNKLMERGIDVEVLTGAPIKVRKLMNLSFVAKASLQVRNVDADIFHAHGGLTMIPLSIARGRRIMTLHGVWHKGIEFLHGKTAGLTAKLIESIFLEKADIITVVSKDAQKVYRKYKPIYIPNGIDAKEFASKATNPIKLPRKSVLYVGRLSKEKGIDVLIHAWRTVHKRIPEARLYIIGTGPLENKIRTYHGRYNIKFVGWIPHNQIPNWLYNTSAFVMPSIQETGMPMAILEAMAMKVPVIATKTGGISDIITNEKTGIMIKPNSTKELASALIRVLTENMEKIVENAYENIKRNYNLDKILDAYLRIYQKLSSKQTQT